MKQRAVIIGLLVCILLLALGLRFYRLDAQSYWSDEGASVTLALGPLADIAPKSAADIHPPLYYYLLWGWVRLFGPGEFATRALSALAGTLLVALTFAVGRRTMGTISALVGTFLCAISPLLIHYSQETRMYELMALWGVLSAWLLLLMEVWPVPVDHTTRVERHVSRLARVLARPIPTKRASRFPLRALALWLGYVTAATLGLYTQYFFFTVLLWQNIYVLYRASFILYRDRDWKRLARRLLLPWLAAQATVGALFLPWALRVKDQLAGWPSYGEPFALPDLLRRVVETFTFGPAAAETLTGKAELALWALVGVSAIALLWAIAREWRRPQSPSATFIALYLFVPIAAVYVLSQGRPMDKPDFLKQILAAVPAYCLFLGLGIDGAGRLAGWIADEWIIGRLARGSATVTRVGHWLTGKLALGRLAGTVGEAARAGHDAAGKLAFGRFAQATHWGTDQAASATGGWLAGLVVRVLVVLAVVAGLTFFSSRALDAYYHNPKYARDDYRGLATFVAASEQPGDAIILNAPGQIEIFELYYHGPALRYPLPRQRPIDEGITATDLEAIAQAHDRVWLVLWAVEESDPGRFVEGWLDAHAYKTLDQWYGNVRLVLYQVASDAGGGERPLELRLGEAILLRGYALPPAARAGDIAPLTLFWQALGPVDRRYKVFAHIVDDQDYLWGQRDAEPVGNARPTTSWAVGEVITDTYGLLVLPGTPLGQYHVEVGMYGLNDGARLPMSDASGASRGDRVLLGPLVVTRPAVPPSTEALRIPHALDSELDGSVRLLGYGLTRWGEGDERAEFAPGDVVLLTLFWRATEQPAADYVVRVQLLDSAGQPVMALDAAPGTASWQPGDAVRDQHRLALGSVAPGVYHLTVALVAGDGRVAGPVGLGPVTVR
ncbi:MAG: glycosyltransferase family 39 protein [Chloroflexi bacterium]|nr:glycosyltransferase family 39 protein [Chloroflexota bacterium]MBU1747746.1 glycosyltransferase family 39 protein [Chloroflexota bacterium]MBU1877566.1 glycosyltransferase family 39 protein [Chloroflexota bacterium]